MSVEASGGSAPRRRGLRDLQVSGRRVLARVDFNVPVDEGRVTDDTRIRRTLPTLDHLLEQDCRLVLATHLGRPRGRVVPGLRLDPVARRLADLLGRPVHKTDEVVGDEARRGAGSLEAGELLLLENVRFDAREEANDPDFARALAGLAEIYVNDAFGAAHRAHASTCGVAAHLPAAAGLLMTAELEALGRLLHAPQRPFWAVLGGAKVADKLGVLHRLLDRCDGLIVGGGMANTLLAAQGHDPGASPVETERLADVRAVLDTATAKGVRVLLPRDLVAAEAFVAEARHRTVERDALPAGWQALDVGPGSLASFRRALAGARTVFWNGPLGVFEWPAFARGTLDMARTVAGLQAWTVVGGGDSLAALRQAGVEDRIGHLSTGGGAALAFLEGRRLPGVAMLPRAKGG